MKRLLIFCLLLSSSSFLTSQDLVYSQFNAMPLELNPAFAGNNSCNYRISTIGRSQWVGIENVKSYQSASLAADFNLNNSTDEKLNLWGLGFLTTYDRYSTGSFNNIKLIANLAYHLRFGYDGKHFISFGLQGGASNRSVSPDKLLFGDQIDPYGNIVSATSSDGNQLQNQSKWNPEMNFGTLLTLNPSLNSNIYIGASIYNILSPNISFSSDKHKLPVRYNIHAGGAFAINRFILRPSTFFQYQQFLNYNIGTYFGMVLVPGDEERNPINGFLGVWYKSTDAVATALRFDIGSLSLAFSYDIHVGKITQDINSIGSPELSINYFGCFGRNSRRMGCPSL